MYLLGIWDFQKARNFPGFRNTFIVMEPSRLTLKAVPRNLVGLVSTVNFMLSWCECMFANDLLLLQHFSMQSYTLRKANFKQYVTQSFSILFMLRISKRTIQTTRYKLETILFLGPKTWELLLQNIKNFRSLAIAHAFYLRPTFQKWIHLAWFHSAQKENWDTW